MPAKRQGRFTLTAVPCAIFSSGCRCGRAALPHLTLQPSRTTILVHFAELEEKGLSVSERALILGQKADHTALGFDVLLKYIQIDGRFPGMRHEAPPTAIVHLAQQIGLAPTAFVAYDWERRTIKAHPAAIRTFLGLREATIANQEALTAWLVTTHVPEIRQIPALIEQVKNRCHEMHLELPTPDRVKRLVRTAIATFDTQLTIQMTTRLAPATCQRLDVLLQERPATATAVSGRGANPAR